MAVGVRVDEAGQQQPVARVEGHGIGGRRHPGGPSSRIVPPSIRTSAGHGPAPLEVEDAGAADHGGGHGWPKIAEPMAAFKPLRPVSSGRSGDREALARKQAVQGVFDRAATTYGSVRYFPLLGQWLVEMAQIPGGAHVLDVACGQGAVLVPVAHQVGPGGRVIGIDLSERMVQETAGLLHHLDLTQARVLQMDAEQLEFPDATFDFVVCGFSLQFFPHLEQALSEVRRVLKPAGQIAATTWADRDPRWNWYDDLRKAYQAVVKLSSPGLDRREELLGWFSRAGFANIQIATKELDMVYADEDEWWTMQWSISGRAGLERLEPGRLEAFKAEVHERMQTLRQADGFHDRLQAHCTIAVK